MFSVRLTPFFFLADALAVWLCFVVLCVRRSSGGCAGLLCFPSGSVLESVFGWSGVRLALVSYVDKIG